MGTYLPGTDRSGFGDLCKALRPIFGDLRGGDRLIWYCPVCNPPMGDDGDDMVGDGDAGSLLLGDGGGVLDSLGEGGLAGLVLPCLGTLVPGPELSDGVGGSPLLQAIEQ